MIRRKLQKHKLKQRHAYDGTHTMQPASSPDLSSAAKSPGTVEIIGAPDLPGSPTVDLAAGGGAGTPSPGKSTKATAGAKASTAAGTGPKRKKGALELEQEEALAAAASADAGGGSSKAKLNKAGSSE